MANYSNNEVTYRVQYRVADEWFFEEDQSDPDRIDPPAVRFTFEDAKKHCRKYGDYLKTTFRIIDKDREVVYYY